MPTGLHGYYRTRCHVAQGSHIKIGVNDLKTTNPSLFAELRFPEKVPKQLSAGSKHKVEWVCAEGHSWVVAPCYRALGKGCPYCSGSKVLVGFNDLNTTDPEVASKLIDQDVQYLYSRGSNFKAEWLCPSGHTFKAKIVSMTREQGSRCSVCSGRQILVGFNDLGSVYPELSGELADDHYTPETLHAGSNRRVKWRCTQGHEWLTTVLNRVSQKSGCGRCGKGSTSKVEQELFARVSQAFPNHSLKNGPVIKVEWGNRSRVHPDILMESIGVIIEYDGSHWHKDTIERDTYATNNLLNDGYSVLRVRERHNHCLPLLDITHKNFLQVVHQYGNESSFESTINTINSWVQGILDNTTEEKNENP